MWKFIIDNCEMQNESIQVLLLRWKGWTQLSIAKSKKQFPKTIIPIFSFNYLSVQTTSN